jgi:transcriptional regulator with XRE-family HTH domain
MGDMTFRELRQKKGFTQETLAEAAGIDQTTVSLLECGKVRDPRWSTMSRLMLALQVRPERIAQAIQDTEAA